MEYWESIEAGLQAQEQPSHSHPNQPRWFVKKKTSYPIYSFQKPDSNQNVWASNSSSLQPQFEDDPDEKDLF